MSTQRDQLKVKNREEAKSGATDLARRVGRWRRVSGAWWARPDFRPLVAAMEGGGGTGGRWWLA
jgi:hypothetical protein